MAPIDLRYTKEHEWLRIDGRMVTLGITDYAQDSLGEIVFLELPEPGVELSVNDTFGVVESVKAVSDLFSPVSGKVIEVHAELVDSPKTINKDAFGEGWLIRIELSNPSELEGLMDASEYEDFVAEES